MSPSRSGVIPASSAIEGRSGVGDDSSRSRGSGSGRSGRVWMVSGLVCLAYAVLGNYVALPGYRRFLERGGTSASGASFDLSVLVGASKMLFWMFSFQLGVLCLGYAVLRASGSATPLLRRAYAGCAVGWLAFWAVPVLPGPYTAYFAVLGCGILSLIALCMGRLRSAELRSGLGSTAHGVSPPESGVLGVSATHWRLFSYLCFALATWEVCGLGSVGRILHLDEAARFGTEPLLVAQTTKLILELALAWLFAWLSLRSPATRLASRVG